jgi:hypothetical protein
MIRPAPTQGRRRQRGTVLVELALTLTLLLTLVAYAAFYGRLLYTYQVMQKASHDAVRYLSSTSRAAIADPLLAPREQALTRAIVLAELRDLGMDPPTSGGPFIFIHCDENDCVGNAEPKLVSVEVQLTIFPESLSRFIPFATKKLLRARNVMRHVGT